MEDANRQSWKKRNSKINQSPTSELFRSKAQLRKACLEVFTAVLKVPTTILEVLISLTKNKSKPPR